MTKIEMVSDHLKKFGSITPSEAREKYGSDRLSSIINKLRDRGMNIRTELVSGKDRFGNDVHFAKYWYFKKE